MDNIVEHLADHLEKISVMALPSDQSAEPLNAVPPTLSYPSSESFPPVASIPSVQPLPVPPSINTEVTPNTRGKGIQNQPLVAARVLYDFSGQKENELSMKSGQIIMIVQKENNGIFQRPILVIKLLLIELTIHRLVASQERQTPRMDSIYLC